MIRVVESVTHTGSLCVCPLNNDLRTDMVTKLRARICVRVQLTLALPEENPDLYGCKSCFRGTLRNWASTSKCRSGRSQLLPLMRVSVQMHLSRSCGSLRLKRSKSSRM